MGGKRPLRTTLTVNKLAPKVLETFKNIYQAIIKHTSEYKCLNKAWYAKIYLLANAWEKILCETVIKFSFRIQRKPIADVLDDDEIFSILTVKTSEWKINKKSGRKHFEVSVSGTFIIVFP